jgi:outer membrane biosynthesis protein TonB
MTNSRNEFLGDTRMDTDKPAEAPAKPKKTKRPKPKAKKAAKRKAPAKKKTAKRPKPKAKKVNKSAKAPARTIVRTERVDVRVSKAEKARLKAKAVKMRRTVTSVLLEAIEKIK